MAMDDTGTVKVLHDYSDKLYEVINNTPDTYKETGLISGSKLGYTPLVVILRMIGVEAEFDDYTKGKFLRGHDLELRIIGLVWGYPDKDADGEYIENEWYTGKNGHKFCWQYRPEQSYRGTSVTIDLIEDMGDHYVIHEIKSATKLSWDKTAALGGSMYEYKYNYQTKKRERLGRRQPEVKPHNVIQAALQGLTPMDKPVREVIIHYVNADDYRIISFSINPQDSKQVIDEAIDKVLEAFVTKQFPIYYPLWGWDKGKYNSYEAFEKLETSDQIREYLKANHKEALDKFMLAQVKGDNIIYAEVSDESK